MNNSNFNVVLQRVGDESPITLGDEKCLIRTVLGNERVDCCAIINGPNGTAIRSYRSGVLVNGEPTSVRELSTGDVIELPCETKIEVQQATQIRPVVSDHNRSPEDIDQQLSKIQAAANTGQASSPESSYLSPSVDEDEESFHSPFSTDLPEITSESFGQPVASTVLPENQLTAADASAGEVPTVDESASIDEQDLESIFAKLGVTNVGSIANPVVKNSVNEEAAANLKEVGDIVESSAQVDPREQRTPSVLDEAAEIRRQLEAATRQTVEVTQQNPEPKTLAPEVVSPESTSSPVVAQPVVAQPVVAQPVAAQPVTDVPQPATPVVASAPPVPAKAVSTEPVATVEAEEDQEESFDALPADLRDQLNDLVSSLKTSSEEAATLSSEAPPVASVPQPSPVEPPNMAATSNIEPTSVAPPAPRPAVFAAAATPATLPTQAAPSESVAQPAAASVPTASPEPAVEQNRSVADVLGAMGVAIPGDDETETVAHQSQLQQPQEVAPTQQPIQEVPSSPVFAEMQNANSESADAEGNADEDIQAYMNRLLNRSDSTPPPQQAAPVVPKAGVPAPKVQEKPKEVVPVLSEEEFVPTHKASRPENYDTLREIANTTSRTAIENSSKNVKKSGLLNIVLAVVLFTFAAVAYLFLTGTLDKFTNENAEETTVQQTEAQ